MWILIEIDEMCKMKAVVEIGAYIKI